LSTLSRRGSGLSCRRTFRGAWRPWRPDGERSRTHRTHNKERSIPYKGANGVVRTVASRTAEFMALFRAIESSHPEGLRLFDGPFARSFLPPSLRVVTETARLPMADRAVSWLIDRRWPGARTSEVARTRLIDDALSLALRGGAAVSLRREDHRVGVLGSLGPSSCLYSPECVGKKKLSKKSLCSVSRADIAGTVQQIEPSDPFLGFLRPSFWDYPDFLDSFKKSETLRRPNP
jgi:hypothetical protein